MKLLQAFFSGNINIGPLAWKSAMLEIRIYENQAELLCCAKDHSVNISKGVVK